MSVNSNPKRALSQRTGLKKKVNLNVGLRLMSHFKSHCPPLNFVISTNDTGQSAKKYPNKRELESYRV